MSEYAALSPNPTLTEGIAALRGFMLASHEFRQAIAARFGVTVTDTMAMSQLAAHGELTAGDLSERLGLAASSITALLDRLEAAGAVVRRRDVGDRRAVTVALTEKGSASLGWAGNWMQAALSDLGAEDLRAAVNVLSRLAESLHRQLVGINTTELPQGTAPEDRPARTPGLR